MNAFLAGPWLKLTAVWICLTMLCGTATAKPDASVVVDRCGDPLPPGAVARLGSARFRSPSDVTSLAYTPDGKFLVGGSSKGICIWDATTGRLLRRLGMDLPDGFGPTAVSKDGKFAAVGRYFGNGVAVYEVAGGRRVWYSASVNIALEPSCFSPDGKILAARCVFNDELLLFDAATGKPLREWKAVTVFAAAVAFTPDGKSLITAERKGTIRFRDPRTGKSQRQLPRSPDGVSEMALSLDGSRLATVGNTTHMGIGMGFTLNGSNKRLRFWDLKSGKAIRELRVPTKKDAEGAQSRLDDVAFDPNGKWVWTIVNIVSHTEAEGIELSGVLQVWDWETGKEVKRFANHCGWVGPIAFAPDGKSLAVVEKRQILRIRELPSGRDRAPLAEHRGKFTMASVSPDGRMAATAGEDRTIGLWDLSTGTYSRRLPAHKGRIARLFFSSDGGKLISEWRDGLASMLSVWDVRTRKECQQRKDQFEVVSHDGRVVAVVKDSRLSLLDIATGRLTPTPIRLPADWNPIASALDEQTFLGWTSDRTFHRWDLRTGKHSERFCSDLKSDPQVAVVSPDRRLAALSFDDRIAIVDLTTVREVRRITQGVDNDRGIRQFVLAFSPDGRTLAWSDDEDSTIYLTEIASGRIRRRLAGHQNKISSLEFSLDGRHLLSTGLDATALVWDLTCLPGVDHRPLSKDELASCWSDLQQPDAVRANAAQVRLRRDAGRAVEELALRLRPIAPMEERRIAQRIADLDSDAFAVRERATLELALVVEMVEQPLRRVLTGRPSLEMRRRVQALLEQLDVARSPEHLRQTRAVETLEAIDTAEAGRLLRKLSTGAEKAIQTREAKAALRRLTRLSAIKP